MGYGTTVEDGHLYKCDRCPKCGYCIEKGRGTTQSSWHFYTMQDRYFSQSGCECIIKCICKDLESVLKKAEPFVCIKCNYCSFHHTKKCKCAIDEKIRHQGYKKLVFSCSECEKKKNSVK